MAKRKRRKSAGPPPVNSPRRAAMAAAGEAPAKRRAQAPPGRAGAALVPGVALRAGIVAAIFYPYLIYIVGEEPGPSLLITVLAFGLMLPLGILLDRFRYRRQMRQWEERRAARPSSR